MKLENLKLSEVIKLIEDKPDEVSYIYSDCEHLYNPSSINSFTISPYFWTSRKHTWTVELKPIKKELTRNDLAEAWDVASNLKGFTKIKSADESKFFKAICERLEL